MYDLLSTATAYPTTRRQSRQTAQISQVGEPSTPSVPCSLPCHCDAKSLLGRDQVVGVFGALAEIDLHPVDRACEDAALALVVVADRGRAVSSAEKISGTVAPTRPSPLFSPST